MKFWYISVQYVLRYWMELARFFSIFFTLLHK